MKRRWLNTGTRTQWSNRYFKLLNGGKLTIAGADVKADETDYGLQPGDDERHPSQGQRSERRDDGFEADCGVFLPCISARSNRRATSRAN